MNKRMLLYVFLLALFVGGMCNFLYTPIQVEEELTPVVSSSSEDDIIVVDMQRIDGHYYNYIWVLHDNIRNVTCWKVDNGLSCIPDYMLEESKR